MLRRTHNALSSSRCRRRWIPTGTPILANVEAAIEAIAASARDHDLLVVRATVPIGTSRKLAGMLAARGRSLLVAACPDRSVAGRSFRRAVFGAAHHRRHGPACGRSRRRLFGRLGPTVQVSTPETAEAVKLFANVQRDVTFALANQFALVSEQLDLDFGEIVRAGSEGYRAFLAGAPGPGRGTVPAEGYRHPRPSLTEPGTLDLARAARKLNESLLDHVANAVKQHLDRANVRGRSWPCSALPSKEIHRRPIDAARSGSRWRRVCARTSRMRPFGSGSRPPTIRASATSKLSLPVRTWWSSPTTIPPSPLWVPGMAQRLIAGR